MVVVFMIMIAAICAVAGYAAAKARHRDPATWAVICFFTGFIGLIALFLMGENTSSATSGPAPSATTSWDRKKWSVLKDVDPEIAAAVEKVTAYGAEYEAELAGRYLVLNDKTCLNSIVEYVLQRQRKDWARLTAQEIQLANAFASFSATADYGKKLQNLNRANLFETGNGVAFVLRDSRCVQIENSGKVAVYADRSERNRHHGNDRKWNLVNDRRKQAHIDEHGEAVIKELFMQEARQQEKMRTEESDEAPASSLNTPDNDRRPGLASLRHAIRTIRNAIPGNQT